jgi:hypothetical protein
MQPSSTKTPSSPVLSAAWSHKSRKCAEVLVPQRVEAQFILGAYVADAAAQVRLAALGCTLPILVNPVLFFR